LNANARRFVIVPRADSGDAWALPLTEAVLARWRGSRGPSQNELPTIMSSLDQEA
jgi:hypothetical protein